MVNCRKGNAIKMINIGAEILDQVQIAVYYCNQGQLGVDSGDCPLNCQWYFPIALLLWKDNFSTNCFIFCITVRRLSLASSPWWAVSLINATIFPVNSSPCWLAVVGTNLSVTRGSKGQMCGWTVICKLRLPTKFHENQRKLHLPSWWAMWLPKILKVFCQWLGLWTSIPTLTHRV